MKKRERGREGGWCEESRIGARRGGGEWVKRFWVVVSCGFGFGEIGLTKASELGVGNLYSYVVRVNKLIDSSCIKRSIELWTTA